MLHKSQTMTTMIIYEEEMMKVRGRFGNKITNNAINEQ